MRNLQRAAVFIALAAISSISAQTPKESLPPQLYRRIAGQETVPGIRELAEQMKLLRQDQGSTLRQVRTISQKLAELDHRVESLDVTRNTDRLTVVEQLVKDDRESRDRAEAAAKADHEALMKWVRPGFLSIFGALVGLIGSKIRDRWKERNNRIVHDAKIDQKVQDLVREHLAGLGIDKHLKASGPM